MTTQVKEWPILFKGEMVRAILDGRKTVTRRIIKLPPAPNHLGNWEPSESGGIGCTDSHRNPVPEFPVIWHTRTGQSIACPFGFVGERLWVREGWRPVHINGAVIGRGGDFYTIQYREGFGVIDYRKDWKEFYGPLFDRQKKWDKNGTGDLWTKWKPSIHMRREYSRINLEVVSVGVERLQDITDADCELEGIDIENSDYTPNPNDESVEAGSIYHFEFQKLWNSINGPDSWDLNPWVWRVEFKKL